MIFIFVFPLRTAFKTGTKSFQRVKRTSCSPIAQEIFPVEIFCGQTYKRRPRKPVRGLLRYFYHLAAALFYNTFDFRENLQGCFIKYFRMVFLRDQFLDKFNVILDGNKRPVCPEQQLVI